MAGVAGRTWKLHRLPLRSRSSSLLRRTCISAASSSSTPRIDDEGGRASTAQTKRERIVVLGGGFGGLYTALRLDSMAWPNSSSQPSPSNLPPSSLLPMGWLASLRARATSSTSSSTSSSPEVILVDRAERFTFKPLLYELLIGDADVWEVCPRYDDLLSSSKVSFRQEEVTGVQSGEAGGIVRLASGEEVAYDWLVVALGSGPKPTDIPGALEHALPFVTLEHALRVQGRLSQLEEEYDAGGEIPVVVVGGGVSGVEVAATVAQRLGRRGKVSLVHSGDQVMESAPSKQREAAVKVLQRRGVDIKTNFRVRSVEGADNGFKEVVGGGEETLRAGLVIWTAGSAPITGPLTGSFARDDKGGVSVEPTLKVRNEARVFAMGDVVVAEKFGAAAGSMLPPTAQVAFQQADYAAWNVWASINDRPLLPFRYQDLGSMMVLGSNDAAMVPLNIDALTVDGPLAALSRKAAYLYRMPTPEHAAKVGLSWLMRPLLDSVSKKM